MYSYFCYLGLTRFAKRYWKWGLRAAHATFIFGHLSSICVSAVINIRQNGVVMDIDFINRFRDYQRTGNFWLDLNPLTKLNICLAFAISALVMMDYRYGIPLCLFICVLAAFSGKFKEFITLFGRLTLIIVVFVTLIRQIGMRTTSTGVRTFESCSRLSTKTTARCPVDLKKRSKRC